MQPLIHKVALATLDLDPHASGVSPGDPIALFCESNSSVSAYVSLPSRLLFGLGGRRQRRLGTLGPKASRLLIPALARQAHMRVRVVEVGYAHLNPRGMASVSISVWGDPKDLIPNHQQNTIFSRSRINDPLPQPSAGKNQQEDP